MQTRPRLNPAPAFTRGETPDVLRQRAWSVASRVADPDIPALTVADLGILQDIRVGDGTIEVFITPTDPGSPAMRVIALNIEASLEEAGFGLARITPVLSPAWTVDWMSPKGRATLKRAASPAGAARRRALLGA